MAYTLYILHFDRPVFSGQCKTPFQHYVGYSKDFEKRVEAHRNGNGARWVAFMQAKGAKFEVARRWDYETQEEARKRELAVKRNGIKKYCPKCWPWGGNGKS